MLLLRLGFGLVCLSSIPLLLLQIASSIQALPVGILNIFPYRKHAPIFPNLLLSADWEMQFFCDPFALSKCTIPSKCGFMSCGKCGLHGMCVALSGCALYSMCLCAVPSLHCICVVPNWCRLHSMCVMGGDCGVHGTYVVPGGCDLHCMYVVSRGCDLHSMCFVSSYRGLHRTCSGRQRGWDCVSLRYATSVPNPPLPKGLRQDRGLKAGSEARPRLPNTLEQWRSLRPIRGEGRTRLASLGGPTTG